MGLYEAVTKFNSYYFYNFKFNFTSFNTLPSLTLDIFGFGLVIVTKIILIALN